jgi:hypothetical protein
MTLEKLKPYLFLVKVNTKHINYENIYMRLYLKINSKTITRA